MTLTEFKAWFEGYTENIGGAPTEAQWKRIKKRVGEIDGQTVTERVYVDRYWPSGWGPWWSGPYQWKNPYYTYDRLMGLGQPLWNAGRTLRNNASAIQNSVSLNNTHVPTSMQGSMQGSPTFHSQLAMYALGRAEAEQPVD